LLLCNLNGLLISPESLICEDAEWIEDTLNGLFLTELFILEPLFSEKGEHDLRESMKVELYGAGVGRKDLKGEKEEGRSRGLMLSDLRRREVWG